MGGVFKRGGTLLFGASWSTDATGGPAELCVFVTTEGECAIYGGSDPSGGLGTWSLQGLCRIGRPLGAKAFIKAGGDLLISTDIGAVSLGQAMQNDVAALAPTAVSYPIETEWNLAVKYRSGSSWHSEIWPTKQMVLVVTPTASGYPAQIFAANARTGAWAKFTGWDATCLAAFGTRFFFGSTDGMIVEAEVTGADMGTPYTATVVPLFDDLKTPASLKTVGVARAVYLAPEAINDQITIQRDYVVTLPSAPDAAISTSSSVWGTGEWGESVWGTTAVQAVFQRWRSVYGSGYALSPALQITSGAVAPPNVDLARIDLTFDPSDIVT